MFEIFFSFKVKNLVYCCFICFLADKITDHMKSSDLLWQLFSLVFEILIFLYFCTRVRRLALETKIEKLSDSLGKPRFFNLKLSLDFWKTSCFKHL